MIRFHSIFCQLQNFFSRYDFQKAVKQHSGKRQGGREISTEAGKIDVLAKDNSNSRVIIELKASRAPYSVLGQIL